METRKAVFLGLFGAAVVLGAIVVWPKSMKPSGAMDPKGQSLEPAQESALRAPSPSPAPTPSSRSPRKTPDAPTPSLPASAFEPMIDMPAPPPPDEGAGDDAVESKLPRRLFDGKVALEAEVPSPAKLEGAEKLLGRAISTAERERVTEAFRKHDEEAARAIGSFRLGEDSEEEAATRIRRAEEGYRKDVMSALGISLEQFETFFKLPGHR
jgi:hypothetical protein